ncbi:tRNA 2-selenouridine(34) synthase MnmH [Neobacillus niacini]|uniref:tRNA 2-selenouridine(34) synthase MnmH n=1 Tax=Neobacillus niacini TaxID=86668 RepID=UPI0007AB9960|nr:tRNA 2-selenouridine(34) synthase MnmH [Neobacillus niacini]MEC1521308.1 tRNA 2-selenouridine(34) synthase MnmH [Neobacillus niacini]
MKEITVEELTTIKNPVIIDIRAPIEFKDGAIPEAINIPLFTDKEREEIGTIYKHEGQAKAKWRAMEIVSPKIPSLLQQIKAAMVNGEELIVYCWRGGMRSKAVVTFLEFAGIYVMRLTGGYKAYRQYILQQIPTMFPETAIVLHGLTGVGKTEVLKKLKAAGYPTLDLEGMAAHRGSIFGTIGLGEGNNQKTFDSLLYKGLQEVQGSTHFVMEAESKRIGKAVQPEELMDKKMRGINFYIHTPLEQRVKHLINEYVIPYQNEPWYHGQIALGIEKIVRRIKDNEMKKMLVKSLENKDYQQMIGILLEHYYDPRYDHATLEYDGKFIDIYADDSDVAAIKVMEEIDKLMVKKNEVFEGQIKAL